MYFSHIKITNKNNIIFYPVNSEPVKIA